MQGGPLLYGQEYNAGQSKKYNYKRTKDERLNRIIDQSVSASEVVLKSPLGVYRKRYNYVNW